MVRLTEVGENHKAWSIKYKPLCTVKEHALGNYSAYYHLLTYILYIVPLPPFNLRYL